MKESKMKLNDIKDKYVREIITAISESCNASGLDFFIIGARARDYWFGLHDISARRFTMDVDFAVLVATVEDFNNLKQNLISKYNFKEIRNIPHRLFYGENQFIVDLMPFGGIEKAGYVNFEDQFDTVIHVLGFKEVFDDINFMASEGDIKFATLPGLCILKLIAWNDKPEERRKDIIDFNLIIKYAFDILQEEIYQNHLDLFDDNFNMVNAGSRVLGRMAKRIVHKSDKLKQTINAILLNNIENPDKSKIALIMTIENNNTVEENTNILKEFYKGINTA